LTFKKKPLKTQIRASVLEIVANKGLQAFKRANCRKERKREWFYPK